MIFKKKILLLTFLAIFFNLSNTQNKIIYDEQPEWNEKLDLAFIETQLKTEQILNIIEINKTKNNTSLILPANNQTRKHKTGNNVYLVNLKSGLKAVFKVRPTNPAEVAAYEACKFLGIRLIPPTVIRKINGQLGSLQFFINSNLTKYEVRKFLNQLDQKIKSDAEVFMFVFGQSDCSIYNKMIQIDGNNKANLALIDNERLFFLQKIKYGEKPFIRLGKRNFWDNYLYDKSFPFNDAKSLARLEKRNLKELFIFLDEQEIDFVYYNIQKAYDFKYCIWQDSLWYQYKFGRISFTDIFYRSTLNALKKLNLNALKLIWRDGYENASQEEKKYYEKLFFETLNRRDQIIEASKKYLIIED